jgi:hypothetical protein
MQIQVNKLSILTQIVLALLLATNGHAQDSINAVRQFHFNGYIKSLESLSFNKDFSELNTNNLLHNRINVKWQPAGNWAAVAEFRNRILWGDGVKQVPDVDDLLKNQHEWFSLQKTWIHHPSLVMHTNTERLYLDFTGRPIQFRLGRQRINWGVTTTWNPGDLFNTFQFLDFDFEERPGVDAAKIKYITPQFTTELACSNEGGDTGLVIAFKHAWNTWNYDFQLIAGWYHDRFTIGGGWAGNIKDAGLKGEAQYFLKKDNSPGIVNFSLEGDYMWKTGWYVNVGFLFHVGGLDKPLAGGETLLFTLSPENLMPTKWNVIVTTRKELAPLLTTAVSVLYAPGTNLLIAYPSLQYNIATNLDVDLVWQSFFAETKLGFMALNHQGFLRWKWNF